MVATPRVGVAYLPPNVTEKRVVGVDVGGTKILAGIVDPTGKVEHRRERPTELDSQDRLIEEIGAAAEELLDDSVAAVGFGLPSRIDQQTGRVDGSVNVPLQNVALRDPLTKRVGRPVTLENDGNTAALAEHRAGADVLRPGVEIALAGFEDGLIEDVGALVQFARGLGDGEHRAQLTVLRGRLFLDGVVVRRTNDWLLPWLGWGVLGARRHSTGQVVPELRKMKTEPELVKPGRSSLGAPTAIMPLLFMETDWPNQSWAPPRPVSFACWPQEPAGSGKMLWAKT